MEKIDFLKSQISKNTVYLRDADLERRKLENDLLTLTSDITKLNNDSKISLVTVVFLICFLGSLEECIRDTKVF